MGNRKNAIIGLIIAVLVPVGFWLYYNVFLGLPQPLPKLYYPMLKDTSYIKNGKRVFDTLKVYHTIGDFKLINQNGDTITNDSFKNKIYIANFFFCSCPTICPKMIKNLLAVQEEYSRVKYVRLISHTVDPEHDSIQRLKEYMKKFGVNEKKWSFVTGTRDELYNLCKNSYLLAVQSDGPESFDHSENVVLVDNHRIIRGIYNATDSTAIKKLNKDIVSLLKELAKDVDELKPPKN